MLTIHNMLKISLSRNSEVSEIIFTYSPEVDNGELVDLIIRLKGKEEKAKCCSEVINSILEEIENTKIRWGYGTIFMGKRDVKIKEEDLEDLRIWLITILPLMNKNV